MLKHSVKNALEVVQVIVQIGVLSWRSVIPALHNSKQKQQVAERYVTVISWQYYSCQSQISFRHIALSGKAGVRVDQQNVRSIIKTTRSWTICNCWSGHYWKRWYSQWVTSAPPEYTVRDHNTVSLLGNSKSTLWPHMSHELKHFIAVSRETKSTRWNVQLVERSSGCCLTRANTSSAIQQRKTHTIGSTNDSHQHKKFSHSRIYKKKKFLPIQFEVEKERMKMKERGKERRKTWQQQGSGFLAGVHMRNGAGDLKLAYSENFQSIYSLQGQFSGGFRGCLTTKSSKDSGASVFEYLRWSLCFTLSCSNCISYYVEKHYCYDLALADYT